MAFDKDTDFVGLVREDNGIYSQKRMPPLDFVISVMADLGLITLYSGDTEPAADQATTAWLDTAAIDYAANGTLYLWNSGTSAYALATPALFGAFLAASSNLSTVTLHSGSGTPAAALGVDGDYYINSDAKGSIIGPKAAGAWPATAVLDTAVGASTTILEFDTVADMVASPDIVVSQKTKTLGYLEAGDGGASLYTHDASGTGTADGGFRIDCASTQARSLSLSVLAYEKKFGVTRDGVTEDAPAVQALWDYCRTNNVPLEYGRGTAVISTMLEWITTSTATFTPGPRMSAPGKLLCLFDNQVAGGEMMRVRTDTLLKFMLGVRVKDFSIITTTSPASSSGFSGRGLFQGEIDIDIDGLTLDGLYLDMQGADVSATAGDQIASNRLRIGSCNVFNCGRWGINVDAASGFNELSFLDPEGLFIQGCGTAVTTPTITAITKANPCAVTQANTLADGERIYFRDVGGMTELNGLICVVNNRTASGFTLLDKEGQPLDSTLFTTFTGFGMALPLIPTSGGMRYKGQVFNTNICAFVLCQNVGLFVEGGAGLPNAISIGGGTAFENNYRMHFLCTGAQAVELDGWQTYSGGPYETNFGFVFDGTDSVIRNVRIGGGVVRAEATSNAHTQFTVFGVNADRKTISVNCPAVAYDNYASAGQTKYVGFKDKPNALVGKIAAQSIFSSISAVIFDAVISDEQDTLSAAGLYNLLYPDRFNLKGRLTLTGVDASAVVEIELYNVTTANVEQTSYHAAGGITTESFLFDFEADLGVLGLLRTYSIRAKQSSGSGSKALDVSSGVNNILSVKRIETQF